MIQWYLHSFHVCIVSILFLEDSSHPAEVFVYMVKKQENLEAVTPQPGCGSLQNALSLDSLLGLRPVISPLY